MSKTKKATSQEAAPDYVAELMLNGTAVITAATPEQLAEMVNAIPADCSYGAGAVGFNSENGLYCLRLHLNKIDKP